MSQQQQRSTSPTNGETVPWRIRLCRWLSKLAGFLSVSVVLALAVNVVSTWLTTSKGTLPDDTPLSLLVMYWPISLSVGCCLFFLTIIFWTVGHQNVSSTTSTFTIPAQDRERMLRRLRFRYEQMLIQSLQGAVQVELGFAFRSKAVHNATGLSLRLPDQPDQPLPTHTSIIQVYNLAQQDLLILGEPGAGKSTLLLELAHHLVKRAEQDTALLLPVLLPLSSWATKQPPLSDWLIEQFALLYDIPEKLSQQWIRTEQILPLLDGLDEVEESARADCIRAINTYHKNHLQPLVICSRANEYEAVARLEKLSLHTAVVVQPLLAASIDTYLETLGLPFAGLRRTLHKNPLLQEVATTPLMLQVLMLTYHGTSVRQLSRREVQLRKQIWTDYVQRMVSCKGNAARYPLADTTIWLRWLAQQMKQYNLTEFYIEWLQPAWLETKQARIIYHMGVMLFFGLFSGSFFGLLSGLFAGPSVGLRYGLFFGFFVGLFSWPALKFPFKVIFGNYKVIFGSLTHKSYLNSLFLGLEGRIQPTDVLVFSWKGLLGGLFGTLAFTLTMGLINELFARLGLMELTIRIPLTNSSFVSTLLFFLFAGLPVGLFFGLGLGLSNTQISERLRNRPNQGIQASAQNALRIALLNTVLFGLVFILCFGLFNRADSGVGSVIASFLFFGLSCGFLFGLSFGGETYLRHYVLRFILWRKGVIPWHYVQFLEETTTRILLQRIGGGYRFTHRLLLDYFADLDTAPSSPPIEVHPVQQPPLP